MKKIIKFLIMLIIALAYQTFLTSSFAQVPQKMGYQVIIQNNKNQLLIDHAVGMQISILKSTATGTAVYVETQKPTTNAKGLVSIEIGTGTVVTGTFSEIDWSDGPYFIKTETDLNGGINYSISGTSQLLSVPYALYAKTAENGFSGNYNDLTNKPTGTNTGDILYWNGTAWNVLPIGKPGQYLQVSKLKIPEWSGNADLSLTTIETSSTKSSTYPTLTTVALSSIATTTATSGGNISSDGGAYIVQRGVCWNTSPSPTTANSKTLDYGTNFTSSITGLTPSTTYYVRAYATNTVGSGYGNEVSFTTLSTTPILTTNAISSITPTTATSGGNITYEGGYIVERGVCWSTSPSPTTANSKTLDYGTSFTSSITGLTPSTTYYVRAYAMKPDGVSGYGDEVSFTTIAATSPTLTTTTATSITYTTATSGGNISSDGGVVITARGVCWSTTSNPTTALSTKTTNGTGTGSFTSSITGLALGTVYYVRAYATNSVGTSYGNQISFTTTAATLPTLTTNSASSITTTTATCGGNVSSNGGVTITARGVCWSTTSNPTIALTTKTTDGSGTGTFTSSITGLTLNTTYYIRAYATNSVGTAYGDQVSFSTGVGASYQGGIIAYILQSGDSGYKSGETHGLIIAHLENNGTITWYNNGAYITTGATGTAIGTGNTNTSTIVSQQGNGNYAAKWCSDYTVSSYSDWYLPSNDELGKIYLNKTIIGGFYNGDYWSSTEYDTNTARSYSFSGGSSNITSKSSSCYVCAVRSF